MRGGGNLTERMLEALLFFLERPSVIGDEKGLCDDLEARVGGLPGWRAERVANNLILSRTSPDVSRERLVFAGHLDTVPEPEGGIEVRTDGDLVYGRGASDMKAGDAVMLALLEDLDWDLSWAEPVFVFYEHEEGPYAENGLEVVFEECPWVTDADLAIILEPTENALEAGCIGTAQIEVTFHGTPSHSARPWQGENALTAAGAFLAALHERPAEEVVVDGLPFYEVVVPTMARGGSAKNIVPDSFWINVNHRFAPGRGMDHVEAVFEGLLKDWDASFEVVDFAPSGSADLGSPLLQGFIADGNGLPALDVRPKQAWTDVARFGREGVAAANFGPGSPSQAHQRTESVKLSLLVEGYERLSSYLAYTPPPG